MLNEKKSDEPLTDAPFSLIWVRRFCVAFGGGRVVIDDPHAEMAFEVSQVPENGAARLALPFSEGGGWPGQRLEICAGYNSGRFGPIFAGHVLRSQTLVCETGRIFLVSLAEGERLTPPEFPTIPFSAHEGAIGEAHRALVWGADAKVEARFLLRHDLTVGARVLFEEFGELRVAAVHHSGYLGANPWSTHILCDL